MKLLEDKKWRLDPDKNHAIPSKGMQGLHTLSEIILTKEGDKLLEIGRGEYHREMTVPIGGTAIGVHKYCGGLVRAYRTSREWHTIHCKRCGLRVQAPVSMSTYGGLTGWLEAWIWAETVEKFHQA